MFSYEKNHDAKFSAGSNKYTGVYEGVVKDNSDFQRMGRLAVWVPELGSREDDSNGWVLASYCTPFGGATDPSRVSSEQTKTYEGTQRSYGFWAVPPDKNNRVIVMFLNGEVSRPIWIGCMYQQYANNMVPNIPASKNYQYDEVVPTAEYNRKTGAPYGEIATKPYHRENYEAVRNQGLAEDPVRGFSRHGATSDPTSKVYGMLSPGGHYWSLEDTEGDKKIRLRSSSGAQLLLDDSRGIVYIVNQSGNGWIEIDGDGKLMAYSEGGIGFRTTQDISFSADRDIIFEAGRNIIQKSNDNIFVETDNLIEKIVEIHSSDVGVKRQETIQEEQKYIKGNSSIKVDKNFTVGAQLSINLNAGEYNNFTSKRDTNINSSDNIQIGSAGTLSVAAKQKLNLISTSTMVQSAKSIIQNTGGSAVPPAPSNPAKIEFSNVPKRPTFTRKDVYQPASDDDTLYREVQSVASVYPTHEPSAQHGIPTYSRDEESNSETLDKSAVEINEENMEKSILVNKGSFMESLIDDIRRHEGVIYEVYPDPIYKEKEPTAGVGHLLSEYERTIYKIGDPVDRYQVEKWLVEDVRQALDDAETIYGQYWRDFPDEVKSILGNMSFNMGINRLRGFVKMNQAVINHDWLAASTEMIDSLWYTQTGRRARELAGRMAAVSER